MASTYPAESTAAATQLLEHPVDPSSESSRHRVPRQARSGSPLIGVTAMTAALGAAGFAAAAPAQAAPAAAVTAGDDASERIHSADPGLALAARIQQQADSRRTAAEETARLAAAREAAAKRADRQTGAGQTGSDQTEAGRTQADRSAFAPPVAGYTLSAHYGQSGSYWAHLHTGLDFAAPTGTPVTALGTGTVTSAGWSGAFGYRVIQTLPDGTEIWYCHLARISTATGAVGTGTVLGAVGATGNVTAPHLHLEVRPGGGTPIDPLGWLQAHGVNP